MHVLKISRRKVKNMFSKKKRETKFCLYDTDHSILGEPNVLNGLC